MTSRVPGSSPGGSGVFSLFRQFTSPTDPLNLKFFQSFPNNNNINYRLVHSREGLMAC